VYKLDNKVLDTDARCKREDRYADVALKMAMFTGKNHVFCLKIPSLTRWHRQLNCVHTHIQVHKNI